jgi:hypothetical protein
MSDVKCTIIVLCVSMLNIIMLSINYAECRLELLSCAARLGAQDYKY